VFGVWKALVRNDKTNRPSLKMECLKGGHFKTREGLAKAKYRAGRMRFGLGYPACHTELGLALCQA